MKEKSDSSIEYHIAETESFAKKIEKKEFSKYYSKIKEYIYPLLNKNPVFGPDIKHLKGEFSGLYRCRIGDYRLFYHVDLENNVVTVVDFRHRKDAYKKK